MAFTPGSITSNFGYQDEFQTTLSSSITGTSTAIPLTLLPNMAEGTLVIEPGTANEEEIYYTSQGGGNVNVPSVAAGRGINNTTAISHNAGVAVKMLVTAASFQALQYGGAFQAGSSSQGISAAAIKQETWTSYTPVWTATGTAPALGANGTLTGKYIQVGKLIFYRIRFVAGSSSTYGTGAFRFSLPVATTASYTADDLIGSVHVIQSTSGYDGNAMWVTTTTIEGRVYTSGAGQSQLLSTTHPATYGSGNIITFTGVYESA